MPDRPPLKNGPVLHSGFYDLLAIVPSRLFQWSPRKIPHISNPTGFVYVSLPPPLCSHHHHTTPLSPRHLVHASDADQAEALLTRWGPDGLGKLGGLLLSLLPLRPFFTPPTPDPRWATPIKARVRHTNRAKAINDVVNALKPSASSAPDAQSPPLRVVNGLSTPTSSTLTTAAQENFPLLDGLPPPPGNSTFHWSGGLIPHPEVGEHEDGLPPDPTNLLPSLAPSQRKPITPSLATLEKAVSARIYFENLYFPLLRQPPSREQRRVAMERDMIATNLSEEQKQQLRARWRQNETDYLRDRRRKVDVTAFIKLKTIGHGSSYR